MVGTILRGNVYLLSDYYKQVYRNDEFRPAASAPRQGYYHQQRVE